MTIIYPERARSRRMVYRNASEGDAEADGDADEEGETEDDGDGDDETDREREEECDGLMEGDAELDGLTAMRYYLGDV